MYDMRQFLTRYFTLTLKNGVAIEVEPPKLKVLKKIMSLGKVNSEKLSEQDFDNIILATSMALSKNRQNYNISVEWLTENHNIDELMNVLVKYFEWVDEINSSKN